MDWGSVAGLGLALAGVVLGQWLEGGRLSSLMQPAAFMIVVAGTVGAVLLQSGLSNVWRGVRMLRHVFFPRAEQRVLMAEDLSLWSATARREGLLSLDRYVNVTHDPFVQKALRMVVDGIEPRQLRSMLDNDICVYEMQQRQAAGIWETAGGYAPTVGIIGAVLGLIQVMENLGDPGRLGQGIAVAFVATVYGVGLANLVFLPISGKLKSGIKREVLRRDMLADAFVSIAAGDGARVMAEHLTTYQEGA